MIFGGFLYFVACFVDMDEKGQQNNRGFQLFGHYMQPALMAMFIGWDSVQIHHEYIKFSKFQVRISLYSLIIWMSHLFLIAYWYNRDQSKLSSAEKSYEAGQFFVFLSGLCIFIILGIMNCNERYSKFRLINMICSAGLLIGSIIILIAGCYLYICYGCNTIWCNGHTLAYYVFVFILLLTVCIDCNCNDKQT